MVLEQVRTHVLLPRELVDEIDRRVGPRRRSEFIARATRRVLDVEERLTTFDAFVGSLEDMEIPGWETPESAAEWVRQQRTMGADAGSEHVVDEPTR